MRKRSRRSTRLAAHNLPGHVLQYISGTQNAASRTVGGLSEADAALPLSNAIGVGDASHNVACAACHREHHGAQVDLTAIDNTACQSCHKQRFKSLADDHPDFGNWPYERRTRIVFNHASHRGKHFAEKKQAFDCRVCHASDATGKVQQMASYETACAACHDEKIATSVGRGVAMLTLPTLDVEALKKAGHEIGGWPQAATGDFDGRLPPMMKLLLTTEPGAAQAIAKLGPAFEFQDVDATDPQQLAACAEMAIAIKVLLSDVSRRGPVAVRERLSAVLGREVAEDEVATLMAGLSIDTVRGAAGWLPGVDGGAGEWQDSRMRRVARDAPIPAISGVVGLAKLDPPYAPAGAWSRNDATFSIRYRPAAHADPVLASWLEVLAKTPGLESRPVAMAMYKELSKATAPGLCVSCHSVEQREGGPLAVNWQAYDRTAEPRGFTKFAHGPHLTLPQLADCASCHAINDAANTSASYADLDPHRFVSEFKPLSKRQCAECHTAVAAGDSCQSCHNYHVQTVEDWRLHPPSKDSIRQARLPLRISDFGLRIEEPASQAAIRDPKSEIR